MKVEFKTTKTKYLDLQDMAQKVLNNCKYTTCFEMFLLDYMDYHRNFENANIYDNWYEIRTSVYNNLFVYCAENGLDNVLEKLKKLKDF